jgi:hypothetical protein
MLQARREAKSSLLIERVLRNRIPKEEDLVPSSRLVAGQQAVVGFKSGGCPAALTMVFSQLPTLQLRPCDVHGAPRKLGASRCFCMRGNAADVLGPRNNCAPSATATDPRRAMASCEMAPRPRAAPTLDAPAWRTARGRASPLHSRSLSSSRPKLQTQSTQRQRVQQHWPGA